MEIREIDVFDLYGDGTLVIKTNMDDIMSDFRYAWHIKSYGKLIHKEGYQRNPFFVLKVDYLGAYSVKAFVRKGQQERVTEETTFQVTKKTSPKLALELDGMERIPIVPIVEHVSGSFWKFFVKEESFADGTEFAWSVYRVGAEQPVYRTRYSLEKNLVYQFEDSGEYFVKVFVMEQSLGKRSVNSEIFIVMV